MFLSGGGRQPLIHSLILAEEFVIPKANNSSIAHVLGLIREHVVVTTPLRK